MSARQLEEILKDVNACFQSWGPDSTIAQMRADWDELFTKNPGKVGAKAESVDLGGVPALKLTMAHAEADRAILYLHGGGYVFGSSRSHRDLGEYLSRAARAIVYVLDYRLAPEHPFPAAVDDATAAYRWLLRNGLAASRLVIAGDSAGGGLTLATLLNIKGLGLPLPACALPLSPWTDLECAGQTWVTKAAEDPIVNQPYARELARTYVQTGDLRQPLASPVNGDLGGLPPLLIQIGEREVLLDDCHRFVELARAAGVDVAIEVEPGQIHVYQIFASRLEEGERAIERMGRFILQHTGG